MFASGLRFRPSARAALVSAVVLLRLYLVLNPRVLHYYKVNARNGAGQ